MSDNIHREQQNIWRRWVSTSISFS